NPADSRNSFDQFLDRDGFFAPSLLHEEPIADRLQPYLKLDRTDAPAATASIAEEKPAKTTVVQESKIQAFNPDDHDFGGRTDVKTGPGILALIPRDLDHEG